MMGFLISGEMAGRRTSHVVLTLALLAAHSVALPMGPFSHGMMGALGLMMPNGFFMGAGPALGRRFSCGNSFGNCIDGRSNSDMPYAENPSMLSAVTRGIDRESGELEGLMAVIEDTSYRDMASQQMGMMSPGGFMPPGYSHMGMMPGMGGGFTPPGAFGNSGFFGALNGMAGSYGMYGSGGGSAGSLELTLELNMRPMAKEMQVVLVFTEFVSEDTCTSQSMGAVMTGPNNDNTMNQGDGFGFGAGMLMQPGMGNEGNLQEEFGVIAQLNVKGGSNTFRITDLGSFTSFEHLAGRGIAVCEDVMMGVNQKLVCTGRDFGVLFCARLGYNFNSPVLNRWPNQASQSIQDIDSHI